MHELELEHLSPFEGIEDGLLASVGKTPLVRLRRVLEDRVGRNVEVWGKAEWFNPGGSVKDRPALAMILEAERSGRLREGMTILDASSGNTGIAYALICAVRGYRLRICLPANANEERKRVLRAYGAEIVETNPLEGSDGAIRKARELAAEHPEVLYLDQYGNEANWQAHYGSTGPEIWTETGGRITHFVAALGTTGTFMGTSRYLKERNPEVVCISIEPDSAFHGLEGMKHMESAIVPPIYDPGLADEARNVRTEAAYTMMRRLAAEEGLLVGPSSAAAVLGAIEVAETLSEGVVVTILCDSGTRYLSESHLWEEEEEA